MKRKVIGTLKIYLITALYVGIVSFIYSFYIMKTQKDINPIIEVIIGASSFFIMGLLFSNFIHKKGLIVGIISAIINILLIHFIYFLSMGKFNISILPFIIYTISSGIGGILGVNFKKII
ncbi:MAG: TIGR04086 family membrane protein [Acholeplasmatales bacterium]|nr:TIGR04086 family membrane protein [Acholeplasmatales bacterium]